jgi:hypothetical protein
MVTDIISPATRRIWLGRNVNRSAFRMAIFQASFKSASVVAARPAKAAQEWRCLALPIRRRQASESESGGVVVDPQEGDVSAPPMRNRKVVANRSAGVARSREAKPAKITEIVSIVTATAISKRRESMTSAKAPAGKVNNNIDRSGPNSNTTRRPRNAGRLRVMENRRPFETRTVNFRGSRGETKVSSGIRPTVREHSLNIALEEHFIIPGFHDYLATSMPAVTPEAYDRIGALLSDFGDQRLAAMDEAGVTSRFCPCPVRACRSSPTRVLP